ncbi:peroxisomal assembly protein [Lecanora helva]
MESPIPHSDHPKRRRRRRKSDRVPLFARLTPRDRLKGNNGVISHDLFTRLFQENPTSDIQTPQSRFIAITPVSSFPQDNVQDASWTILPVEPKTGSEEVVDEDKASSIIFPADSLGLQNLFTAWEDSTYGKKKQQYEKGMEVRVLDVEPLRLDAIYVTIDGDALVRHEEIQRKFGGGFHGSRPSGKSSKGKGKAKAPLHEVDGISGRQNAKELDVKLSSAIRQALATSVIIHQNDILPLPLPSHPITHVSFPPARITLCEPVSQGLMIDSTNVIVNRLSQRDFPIHDSPSLAFRFDPTLDDCDTSNEQFFSATESEQQQAARSDTSESQSNSDDAGEDSDESSDDSLQNLMSMRAPQLSIQNSLISSSTAATTPRAGGSIANGAGTPGSVFSNFSTATARQCSKMRTSVFRARSLLSKIPDEILHPKPAPDEDEEARIFVDMKALMKIGCFSGDWVQLEAASHPDHSPSDLLSKKLDLLDREGLHSTFRPAKVYGLADLLPTSTVRITKGTKNGRRSSVSMNPGSSTAALVVWLSPVLLANLGQPEAINVVPLKVHPSIVGTVSQSERGKPKADATAYPPVAREMTFLRISTPLSTERALQTGIFAVLKHHFEVKRRILKEGDLLGLFLDTSVSRLVAQPASVTDADQEVEELFSKGSGRPFSHLSRPSVVWFRVGHIATKGESEPSFQDPSANTWGGAACIEPTTTRMRQAGSEICRIPSSLSSSWQYYFGEKPSIRSRGLENSLAKYASSMPQPFVAPLRRRLRELLAAATSPQALHFELNPIAVLLHSTQRSIGKATLASHAASDIGLHIFDLDAHDILAEGGSAGDVKTEALLKARVERALSCGSSNTVVLIRHGEALTADRMITALREIVPDARAIIVTTTDIENIPDGIRSLFTHELEVTAPDEGEREEILKGVVAHRGIDLASDVDLSSIAVKSAALVAGDLVDIVDRAVIARQDRLEHLVSINSDIDEIPGQLLVRDILVAGGEKSRCVTKADFDYAVEAARKNFADAIGAPKIPNVSWDDVGGLENAKDAVMETIQLPLERPELFAKGMKKRSGILFYGPPGTGKTLLAKAIATEFSLNFFSIKGPELLNMYIGESEANVRRVFQRARDARPCVVFFDELDSVAPKRGNQGDSGGVMDRIVSQLLAELDGMSDGEEGGGGVFVIGATNRPDLLDPALLRPGRFDKMLYLGISDTHAKQLTILEALTRKFTMHAATSLYRVAESLPFTYTGADLYALCSDAMLKAITRQALVVDAKIKALPNGPVTTAYFFDHLATDDDISVRVSEEDFYAAQRELVGSVSAKELEHYQRVRQTFEGPSEDRSAKPSSSNPPHRPLPPTIDGHLEPPVLARRPQMKSRSSTAKQKTIQEPKAKGKGRPMQWDSSDDEDDDAYVTSNTTPERRQSNVNGSFHGAADDDDELYR